MMPSQKHRAIRRGLDFNGSFTLRTNESIGCVRCGASSGLMMDGVELDDSLPQDTCIARVYLSCDCCGARFAVGFVSHGGATELLIDEKADFDANKSLRVRCQKLMLEWDRDRQPGKCRLG